MNPTIEISRRGAKRVRNGHLWVYRSDLLEDGGAAPGGSVVSVSDEAGNFVGKGFYSDQSEIALRFLTTHEATIDREWWRLRLHDCMARRAAIASHSNAFRVIFSEGDLLPSVILDVYDKVFVLQTLSQGSEAVKGLLVELLVEDFAPRAVIERNDVRVRALEGLEMRSSLLYGDAPAELLMDQHGVRFRVSPLSGQKTGAFLDQRENYRAARAMAHGKGLDCFTFNGGFALHLAGACDSVLAIDISADAVAAARENALLNGIQTVEFREANVFDALRELETGGERFDTIVLDPPAFAKNRRSIAKAVRGYKEINLRALKLLNPGGVLVTCSCSYHISEQMFLEIVTDASVDARRRLQIVEKRTQASDHPILAGMPETHYLKCIIARVIQ
ncbi:MAG: rRNA (cytosine1962-C5)-methyltransferase [Blastocatellia bacterium]|jgi:23S rRNA (cytosine1962-C5)-methyltransferase|nr:rRNA (cytosine1962-C5)-methyltransferase [Blastocatellia bacterium]